MFEEEVTKEDLSVLANSIYMTAGSPFPFLSLLLKRFDPSNSTTLITESDIVEPAIFFKKLEAAATGMSNSPSSLRAISGKVQQALIHTSLINLPLFINDKELEIFVKWRFKLGI